MKRAAISNRAGLLALSPVIVFLLLYLAVSVAFNDFYRMPISVALLIGAMWAVCIRRRLPLVERVEEFSRAAANSHIIYMIWIFIMAGAFAAMAKSIGAVDATVNLTLNLFPHQFVVPGLFMAACLISLSIGTSVGTVVALAPLAVGLVGDSPDARAFMVAVVLGGAFFGDNLSFISDTTIAATRTQGCSMADKFRVNVWIAVPAALVTFLLYMIAGFTDSIVEIEATGFTSDVWLVMPYLVVIILAAIGVNVVAVLTVGLLAAFTLGIVYGFAPLDLFASMGEGIDSMGSLIIITLLAAGMLGLIKTMGGLAWLLSRLTAHVHGCRGAQGCIALLTGLVNVCTANNTVAILTVGEIASDISRRFGVDPRKSASLLDTSSCVVQCLIPYGAQTLLATSLGGVSPAAPWPYLYYAWALALVTVLSIVFRFPRLKTAASQNEN